MIIRHLFDQSSCTITHLIIDETTKQSAIIDPVLEQLDQYLKLIKELKLTLCYVLDTHTHADHVTASGHLKQQTGCRIAMSHTSQAKCVDIHLHDNDELMIGQIKIKALSTPGHTDDSMCYVVDHAVFTGDTLLIRGTGRTDFQSGDARAQYDNIMKKLFTLPDETIVYPAHDYKVTLSSTIGEEKRFNPRLQVQSADEYEKIMNELKLDRPKKMDIAIPANLQCGLMENKNV